MSVLIQFTVIGLGTGALYALAALGVVIVHRGSGVINFAHGAIGILGAYTFFELHEQRHWSFWAALPPGVAVCAGTGMLVQVLVMRPLRRTSPLAQLLATLGVLSLVQGLVSLRYHQETLVVSSSLPRRAVGIGGVYVGADRLLILLVVLLLSAALAVGYGRTRFGRATAAVAENPVAAAYLGYSPDLIAAVNWGLGSALAGTAAILLAPITGLQIGQLTGLLLPALAAAIVGDMTSFPLALAAGLAIGVAQSLLGRYANGVDWGAAVPFLLVLVVLSARGRVLPDRSQIRLRLPSAGRGRVRLVPLLLACGTGLILLSTVPLSWVDSATTTAATAVVVLSVVVVTGYAGQVSLAQVTLAGCGAWVAGRLVATGGLGFGPALVVGTLAALPLGVLVGLPALRSRGANLGIITLALGVALEALLFNSPALTGGDVGTQVGFISVLGVKLDPILHPRQYAVFVLAVLTLCGLAVANLRRGKAGRRLLAVRANERAAAAVGVNTTAAKLYAFSLASVIAALGGILTAFREPSIVYSNIHAFDSVAVLGYAVIGGIGYVVGPLFGGLLQPGGVGTSIGNLLGASVQNYLPAIGGALLILTLVVAHNGIAELEARRWGRLLDMWSAWLRRRRPRRAVRYTGGAMLRGSTMRAASNVRAEYLVRRVPPKVLRTERLSVAFGDTSALSDLSLEVHPGEVVGLIGPNGAGKTTAIDAITGFVRCSAGRVWLDGVDLSRYPPRRRAEAALARSFQSLELFEDLTVLENLLVATEARSWWSYLADLVRPGRPVLGATTTDAIAMFRLEEDLHRLPTELSYGRRRLVAIARAVAAEPSVILLDEPAAGLNQTQTAELRQLLRHLADDRGMGVLLVEHDVDLVLSSCDRVVALVFGREIARGGPEEVRRNPHVVSAYLGVPEETDTLASGQLSGAGSGQVGT